MKTIVTYRKSDCGCYVDSARGLYAVDAIVRLVVSHGMDEPTPCECEYCTQFKKEHEETGSTRDWFPGNCEFGNEIEDECDDYMNSNYPVDGAYWGRSEQGDWGLWESED